MFSAGRYRGRMVRANLGQSKEKNTPEIRFTFIPTGKYGTSGLENCDAEEKTIFRYMTDGTIDYVIQDLQALGFNRETFAEIDDDHPNAFPFAGIEFDAHLKIEEYKGKPKERWEFARGSAGKPIEDVKVRELDAKYASYLRGGAQAATPKATAAATAGTQSDDIPF